MAILIKRQNRVSFRLRILEGPLCFSLMTPSRQVRESHSAAHALQSAGVDVIAGLVVARKINPDPKYFTDELWDRQNAIPFAFTDPPWWAA